MRHKMDKNMYIWEGASLDMLTHFLKSFLFIKIPLLASCLCTFVKIISHKDKTYYVSFTVYSLFLLSPFLVNFSNKSQHLSIK